MAINKKLISFATQVQFAAQLSAGNIDNRSIVFIEDEKRIWTHGVYFDTSWDYITGKPADSPQDGKTYGRKDGDWMEVGSDVYDWSWLFGISPPGGTCTQQQYDDLLAAAQTGKIFPQATIVQLHPYSPESEALVIEVSVLQSTPLSDVYFISWYVLPDLNVMVQESPRGFVTDADADVYDWTWLYDFYDPSGTCTQQQYDELLAAVQTGKIFPRAVTVYAYYDEYNGNEGYFIGLGEVYIQGDYVAFYSWNILPDLTVLTYQKNSYITKAEIEAVLTGNITSHTHAYVGTSGNQTVSGVKTFGSIPVLPASNPTAVNQAVRKKYVDDGLAVKLDSNKMQVVTALPSSPVTGVFYFIKE